MRPVSISVEGFFAYRQKTTVDLSDAEYFSFEGPTGSGKSSLIDAMVFALYGRVPRLGGGTVAPVISAGAERARVSLRFVSGGEEYAVTRLVSRTKSGGASTNEARLESGPSTLASGASDVTAAIAELLRLSYEDFTRTVVLPQGEFARFLKAPPSERQQLLRGLLDLDRYGQVRALAQAREKASRSVLESVQSRLDRLEVPTDDEFDLLTARFEAIGKLVSDLPAEQTRLDALEEQRKSAQAQAANSENALSRLIDLTPPPDLDALGDLLAANEERRGKQEEQLAAVSDKLETAQTQLAQLPASETLGRVAGMYEKLAMVKARIEDENPELVHSDLAEAESAVVAAAKLVEEARAESAAIRVTHAAHGLVGELQVGEPCPVCQQGVTVVPETQEIADVSAADNVVAESESGLGKARALVAELTTAVAKGRATVEELVDRAAEIENDLAVAAIPEAEIVTLTDSFHAVTSRLKALEMAHEEARAELAALTRTHEELSERQRSVGNLLMVEREKVADLKPDPAVSDDHLVLWKELLNWRDAKVGETEAVLDALSTQVLEAGTAFESARYSLVGRIEDLEIAAVEPFAASIARAHEQARQLVHGFEKARSEQETLQKELESENRTAAVAASLVGYLRSDGFERWLMLGAMSELVGRANTLLSELSEGSYSITADEDGSFGVIDHRNADEIRPIATLSGGETFMVSLALALSLAETLAAGGGGELDAIILDEGFGTLDDESLETVAGVLEGLTARGLMVGIITHVKDLAARAPIRFEVRKGPEGSAIRVVA